jgi:hypothetical protein
MNLTLRPCRARPNESTDLVLNGVRVQFWWIDNTGTPLVWDMRCGFRSEMQIFHGTREEAEAVLISKYLLEASCIFSWRHYSSNIQDLVVEGRASDNWYVWRHADDEYAAYTPGGNPATLLGSEAEAKAWVESQFLLREGV